MSESHHPLLPLRRKRDFVFSSGDGWWESQDGRFLFYRAERPESTPTSQLLFQGWTSRILFQGWQEDGRYWRVSGEGEALELLQRHGLHQLGFPTRREALSRVQDALRLEEG